MEKTISLTVNGKRVTVVTDDQRPLLEVLREELGLTGTKYGCGEAECGACTVLLDGEAVPSCVVPAAEAAGASVVTIEGLARDGTLHPVQAAFLEEEAMQCGYCVPGMILRTVALLEQDPDPSEAGIRSAMNGNICRCNGYIRILAAIRRAARERTPEASS